MTATVHGCPRPNASVARFTVGKEDVLLDGLRARLYSNDRIKAALRELL